MTMKVISISEDGRTIQCYEGDFVCLDQMMEDAIEILKPYACPVAMQYLKMARQLVQERKTEIFKKPHVVKECAAEHLVTEGDAPDIEFKDARRCNKESQTAC